MAKKGPAWKGSSNRRGLFGEQQLKARRTYFTSPGCHRSDAFLRRVPRCHAVITLVLVGHDKLIPARSELLSIYTAVAYRGEKHAAKIRCLAWPQLLTWNALRVRATIQPESNDSTFVICGRRRKEAWPPRGVLVPEADVWNKDIRIGGVVHGKQKCTSRFPA